MLCYFLTYIKINASIGHYCACVQNATHLSFYALQGSVYDAFLLTFVTLKWNSRSKFLWAGEFIFCRMETRLRCIMQRRQSADTFATNFNLTTVKPFCYQNILGKQDINEGILYRNFRGQLKQFGFMGSFSQSQWCLCVR